MVRQEAMRWMLTGALVVGGVAAVGCESMSEGEKTRRQEMKLGDSADMIQQGEADIREGEAMVAKGEAAKKQNNPEGDGWIARGKAKVAEGEAKVKQGRNLKDKAM